MSTICVLAPTIIAGWPAISAAVAGAAAALGLSAAQEAHAAGQEAAATASATHAVEVEVENSEVLTESLATEEQMVFTKGDIQFRVYRDARGQVRVSVQGEGHSHTDLRVMGEQLVGKMTQMFVYNKVMTELKSKGFTVVQNEMAEDESVHIHVRRMAD